MRMCYVVFTDPGHVFESIHRSVDGATAVASACGAACMPDGSVITMSGVAAILRVEAAVSLHCHPEDGGGLVHIERHAILV